MKKLYFLSIILIVISMFIGRMWFSPFSSIEELNKTILLQVRAPRIVAVLFGGAALGLSGLAFQNLFKNYLAGPDILGVTSGSAFGAVLAILFLPFNSYLIQLSSFLFGMIAVALVCRFAKLINSSTIGLILTGIVISAVFSGAIGLFKYLADPYNKLPTIVFWLLGSFSGVGWKDLSISMLPMSLGIIGLLSMGWIFNILSLGDDEAKALGVDIKKWRKIIIIFATLSSSAITALAGMIGWIGLVSPHIARLIVGFDNKKLVPATALIGATLLLVCDDLARTLGPAEIPLSILTNFIGAPILFFILFKKGKMYYVRS